MAGAGIIHRMTLPFALLDSSGGLLYHLRAWRLRGRDWRPFHSQVASWLDGWRPTARRLVLVGPSAGYALPATFLYRFDEIVAYEPDPLARFLFRRRFPLIRIVFSGAVRDLAMLTKAHIESAFLFCNLLGQDWTDDPAVAWHAAFMDALAGREWASFHEVASTTRTPDSPTPVRLTNCPEFAPLMRHFWQGGELVVEDHGTLGLFPGKPREYSIWAFRPGRHHLIEWLRS